MSTPSSPRGSTTAMVSGRTSARTSEAFSLLQRAAQAQAEKEAGERQAEFSNRQVHFLTQTKDFKTYDLIKAQTENFKACYWLALISIVVLIYFDAMAFLVQSPSSSQHHHQHHQQKTYNTYTGRYQDAASTSNLNKEYSAQFNDNNNEAEGALVPQIVGALIRSTPNLYINIVLALFCVLFVLPWSVIAVWSPTDENPNEKQAHSAASSIQMSALFLMHILGKVLGLKVNFEPFTAAIDFSTSVKDVLNLRNEHGAPAIDSYLTTAPQLCIAALIPPMVAYFMFYRRFAHFWKQKDLLRSHPIFVYAPRLGFFTLFWWWLVMTVSRSMFQPNVTNNSQRLYFTQAPSIDVAFGFIFKTVLPTLKQALFPSTQMKATELNAARAIVVEWCTKIYLLLLPYCALMIAFASIPKNPLKLFSKKVRVLIFLGIAVLLKISGMNTVDQWLSFVALVVLSWGNDLYDLGIGEE